MTEHEMVSLRKFRNWRANRSIPRIFRLDISHFFLASSLLFHPLNVNELYIKSPPLEYELLRNNRSIRTAVVVTLTSICLTSNFSIHFTPIPLPSFHYSQIRRERSIRRAK